MGVVVAGVVVGGEAGVVVGGGGTVVGDVGGVVVGVVGGVVFGDFVGVGDFFAVGDVDEDFVPVTPPPTLLPVLPLTEVLTGCVVLTCGLGLWDCVVAVWVDTEVLVPAFDEGPPLLEISTAMIATTPMAAAPMPANKNVRLFGPRAASPRSGSPWYRSVVVAPG